MRYMLPLLGLATVQPDGQLAMRFFEAPRIPDKGADMVARWIRLANTPFDQLTDDEKCSDFTEADKMIAIMDADIVREWSL